jgi:DNA-binding transcriptional ArsR family regulator
MTDIYVALADATRRQILESLKAKPGQSVGQLVELTKLGQPTVSKHLKSLRDANLVSVRTVGQNRFYSVNAKALAPVADWVENFTSGTPSALEEQFEDIGEKVGAWLAAGSTWLGSKVAEQVKIETDPQKLGRELGRKLAEAKLEAEKSAKDVEKQARSKVDEVTLKVESVVNEVKSKVTSRVKR